MRARLPHPLSLLAGAVVGTASYLAWRSRDRASQPAPSPTPTPAPASGRRPLVVGVTAARSGVGKSTLAANLAAYLAHGAVLSEIPPQRYRVLLIDGDLHNGNLALRVAQKLEPNMLDLLRHLDHLTLQDREIEDYQQDLAPFMLRHPALDNLDILAAPTNSDTLDLEQADFERLAAAWFKHYQAIIVSVGSDLQQYTNCVWLGLADQIVLVTQPEISHLYSTAEYAKQARRLTLLTPDQIRLVMTRADRAPRGLDPDAAMASVIPNLDMRFKLDDFWDEATEAANAGEFLALQDHRYAQQLLPLLETLVRSQPSVTGPAPSPSSSPPPNTPGASGPRPWATRAEQSQRRSQEDESTAAAQPGTDMVLSPYPPGWGQPFSTDMLPQDHPHRRAAEEPNPGSTQ